MSKTERYSASSHGKNSKRSRRISVRAVRRDPADLRRFSRAVLSIVLAEAEAQAESEGASPHEQSNNQLSARRGRAAPPREEQARD